MRAQYYPALARQTTVMSAAKHWVFTLNDKQDRLTNETVIDMIAPHCDYLVFQEEKGVDGTKHYQGYAEFKKPERLSSIQKHTGIWKPHWEKRKGTRQQAREYAMKDETRVDGPWESGDKPWNPKNGKQGKRSDLDKLARSVQEKKTDAEIFEEQPGSTLKYLRHIQSCRQIWKPVRQTNLQVHLYYGAPGTGKTRLFWEAYPDGFQLPISKNLWFSGYAFQSAVLIDDFAGNTGLTQLLQILDRYPIQVETKGGHTWFCPDFIAITSNLHPWEWYDYAKRTSSYAALKRRIHKVVHFTSDDKTPCSIDKEEFFEDLKPTHTRFDKPSVTQYVDGQPE